MRRADEIDVEDYYKISVAETTHLFPPHYFKRFADAVCVVTPGDYKTSTNAAIKQLVTDRYMFLLPDEDATAKPMTYKFSPGLYRLPANPSQDTRFKPRVFRYLRDPSATSNDLTCFVQDLKRNLRLTMVDDDGTHHLIFRGSEDLERNAAMNELAGEAFLVALHAHLKMKAQGVSYELFKSVGLAYYQKIQYFIREIIDSALEQDKKILISREFDYVSDLVFKKDGKTVYLDLHDITYQISTLLANGPLSAPCPANVILRIPYDLHRSAFSHPIIFCNEYFLPFMYSDHDISIQTDDSAETEAFKQSIAEELEVKSENADQVSRKLAGKYAPLVIGGVTILFLIASAVAIAAAGPVVITAVIGAAIGAEVSVAGAAAGLVGGSAVIGSGLSSSIYFIARKAIGKREIMTISLENSRLSLKDLHVIEPEIIPADPLDTALDKEEEYDTLVERPSTLRASN